MHDVNAGLPYACAAISVPLVGMQQNAFFQARQKEAGEEIREAMSVQIEAKCPVQDRASALWT
jgi:hypothetical protein